MTDNSKRTTEDELAGGCSPEGSSDPSSIAESAPAREHAVPSKAQIARFLEAWDILGAYEAVQRFNRGWGAFDEAQWPDRPDPAIVATVEWLKGLCR